MRNSFVPISLVNQIPAVLSEEREDSSGQGWCLCAARSTAGLSSYFWFQGTALIPLLNVIIKIPASWTTLSNAIPFTLYVTALHHSHICWVFLAFIFPSTLIRVSANCSFNREFRKSKIHNTCLSLVHCEA